MGHLYLGVWCVFYILVSGVSSTSWRVVCFLHLGENGYSSSWYEVGLLHLSDGGSSPSWLGVGLLHLGYGGSSSW